MVHYFRIVVRLNISKNQKCIFSYFSLWPFKRYIAFSQKWDDLINFHIYFPAKFFARICFDFYLQNILLWELMELPLFEKKAPSKLNNLRCINLKILWFLAQCWDYVEVRDGHSPFSPRIGHYCGTNAPVPITSSSR